MEKNLSTNSFSIKRIIESKDWLKLYALFNFLIYTVSIGLIIYSFINEMLTNGATGAWETIDKFTNESNALLWIFMLFYLFFSNHSFMKDNKFLVSTTVYIFFTFVGYNLILVPNGNPFVKPGDFYYNLQNIWLHVISPIFFISFYFYHCIQNKNMYPKVFWKTLLSGMIYPTIYVIYLSTIPFVLTNDDGTAYSIYGSTTNTKENSFSWVYILGMYLVFFPASFAIYYYSWFFISKKQKKI